MSYARWRERVLKELGEEGFAALSTRLEEGFEVDPLYTADHPPGGPRPEPGWRDPAGAWRICTEHAGGDAEALRDGIAEDVAGGASAIRLVVGAGGLPIGAEPGPARVLEPILSELSDGSVELGLEAGPEALSAARWLLSSAEEAGLDAGAWRLVFHADPLGALAAASPGRAGGLNDLEREQAVLARESVEKLPRARAVAVNLLPYREAGGHAVQELGFAVATGVHYLRTLETAGLSVRQSAGEISFVSGVGGDLFLEIAKLRALRLLWSRALAACGASSAPAPRIHAVSLRRQLASEVPWNNILRVTSSTFAAALGGADVVTAVPFDDGLELEAGPDGRRLARSTQLVLAEESHLARVSDPAGGSYYVESLTERLEREAWGLLREVERRGGMEECLASGWALEEVARAAEEAEA